MELQPKINLIYIAGTDRSGSTLLEMLLSAHSKISTCGEMHIWPHEILGKDVQDCICGKPISKCPFWTEMQKRVEPLKQPKPQLHFFRERHNRGKGVRLRHLWEFYKKEIPEKLSEKISKYGENNYKIFKNFLDVMEEQAGLRPQWVVDSSKDIYRLLWLLKSNLFNIKVLHAIRNPAGCVYSEIKVTHKKTLWGKLIISVRGSLGWTFRHHFISKIAWDYLDPSNYLLIKYEDLALNPKETLKRIVKMIGCEFEEEALVNFRKGIRHTIAGNPMRYQKKEIRLDEAWKEHLPYSCQKITKFITGINRMCYGY